MDLTGQDAKGVMPGMHSCEDGSAEHFLLFYAAFQIISVLRKANQIRRSSHMGPSIDLLLLVDLIDHLFSVLPLEGPQRLSDLLQELRSIRPFDSAMTEDFLVVDMNTTGI